jgi:hypothetical protein
VCHFQSANLCNFHPLLTSGKLTEVTDQVEPESGDWIVIDKYTPSNNEVHLRRANLLTQENLEVIQSAVIRAGK